jgi:hypothetical protein
VFELRFSNPNKLFKVNKINELYVLLIITLLLIKLNPRYHEKNRFKNPYYYVGTVGRRRIHYTWENHTMCQNARLLTVVVYGKAIIFPGLITTPDQNLRVWQTGKTIGKQDDRVFASSVLKKFVPFSSLRKINTCMRSLSNIDISNNSH